MVHLASCVISIWERFVDVTPIFIARLVEESGERADPERGDERRRYYQLTPLGLSVARAEARRLDAMVRAARRKKLIGIRPV